MSEIYTPIHLRFVESLRQRPWYPPKALWRLLHDMHRFAGGRARISRWMEPA